MAEKPKQLSFWSFKSMRLLVSLTFCISVLVNALAQNTLGMAMVCMVKSPNTTSTNSNSPNTTEDDDPTCPPLQDVLNDYQGTFDWGSYQQGFMFSSFFIGALIATIPAGWLADRYNPKTMVTVSICFTTVGCFLSPITAIKGDYIGLVVLRFIMGFFGQALIITGISSISARWIPPVERSTVVALYTVGNQVSTAIGMPLNAFLCQSTFLGGWPAIFYVTGAFGVVSCTLWVVLISNRPETNKFISETEKNYIVTALAGQNLGTRKGATKNIPWTRMLISPALLSCTFSMFSGGLMIAALTNYIPTYLKEAMHINLMSNGLLSALPYIVQSVGKITFALIADQIKRKTKISHTVICKFFNSLECFGGAAFLLACSFMTCSQPGGAVAFLSLASLMLSAAAPGVLTSAVCIAPAFTGIVISMTRIAGQFAAVLAPIMVSSLTRDQTIAEWQDVFFVIAAVMLLAGILFLLFGSASIQPWAKLQHNVSEANVKGNVDVKIVVEYITPNGEEKIVPHEKLFVTEISNNEDTNDQSLNQDIHSLHL